ncbi:uncharacterized protein LOC144434172 [Glandiceps talaboti]
MSTTGIPVIDFSAYSVDKDDVSEDKIEKLIDELYHAFSTVGFVYLSNHGINLEKLNQVFNVAEKFFSLSKEVKMEYSVHNNDEYHGYNSLGFKGADKKCSREEVKEAFTYRENFVGKTMPDEELPEFRKILVDFYKICSKLSGRLMKILAKGLNLPDCNFFGKAHEGMDGGSNTSSIVCHHYLPMPEDYEVPEGQLRIDAHTDLDTLTLVFQDDAGGLEILDSGGQYVPAEPIEGTILVNLGQFMERWSAGKLKATKHRVVIPQTDAGRMKGRQSVIFFTNPDDDVIVECIDKSNKYPPVKAIDSLRDLFKMVYTSK